MFLSQRSGKQFDPQIIKILSQFSQDDLPHGFPNSPDSSSQFDEDATLEPAYAEVSLS